VAVTGLPPVVAGLYELARIVQDRIDYRHEQGQPYVRLTPDLAEQLVASLRSAAGAIDDAEAEREVRRSS
jgi:hypothetical protein